MARKSERIRIDHLIVAILLFSMVSIAFINVLSRYLFHFSFASTEEITINLFVWLTVIGSGSAFERGAQLGMNTLFNVFPKTLKKGVIILSAVMSTLLFLLVDFYMIKAIYEELTLFHATSAALCIPVWIYYIGVPVFSFFIFSGLCREASFKLKALNTEGGK